jgi:hypothetical protein
MAATKRKMPPTSQRAPTSRNKKSTARATQPKKAGARTPKKPAVRAARSAKSSATAAAAPFLSAPPKKIGSMTAKAMDAVSPWALNPLAPHNRTQATTPNFDPLALTRPWMRLCVHMVVANLALQAQMARTAMYLPRAAAALR